MKITYKPLWKLLIDRNLKKQDFCKMAGVSPATVTKMRQDKYITTETIVKICNALNCGLADVMELVEE